MQGRLRQFGAFLLVAFVGVQPAGAQSKAGKATTSPVGVVGVRQSGARSGTMPELLSRTATRIDNRVKSRITNRVDRNQPPLAETLTPYRAAQERVENVK